MKGLFTTFGLLVGVEILIKLPKVTTTTPGSCEINFSDTEILLDKCFTTAGVCPPHLC